MSPERGRGVVGAEAEPDVGESAAQLEPAMQDHPARDLRWDYPLVVLVGYVLVLPFHHGVWRLPVFGDTIQPSEIALGVVVLAAAVAVLTRRVQLWSSPLDLPVVLWFLANAATGLFVGYDKHLLLEISKVAAVCLLYFASRLLISRTFLSVLTNAFVASASVMSLFLVYGFISHLVGHSTKLVVTVETFPYFGPIGRAMGFTSSPNMAGSILLVAVLIKASENLYSKGFSKLDLVAYCLLGIGLIVAVSKTILCLLTGLLVIILFKKNNTRFARGALLVASVLVGLVYLVGSHFVITNEITPLIERNMESGIITDQIHQVGSVIAIETSYMTIKRSCVRIVCEWFPVGVGTRCFIRHVDALKNGGAYYGNTGAYDPHCTPLGTLTEVGFAGVLVLGYFFFVVSTWLRKLTRCIAPEYRSYVISLTAIFISGSLESLATDVMNFRQYWLLLAVLAVLVRAGEESSMARSLDV